MELAKTTGVLLRFLARCAAPEEACGVILTSDFVPGIQIVQPIRNVAMDPESTFQFDPIEQLQVWEFADANGLTVSAVYHSHPNHGAEASELDLMYMSAEIPYYVICGKDGDLAVYSSAPQIGNSRQS